MRFIGKKILKSSRLDSIRKSRESIFTAIYRKNLWGGKSRSGAGSDIENTENIRMALPKLLKDLEIHSVLDIPCGDLNWLKEVNFDIFSYIGADIVEDIIIHNNENFSNKNRKFIKLDILYDNLPTVDLILCRDLFQHLSTNDIWKSLENIKMSNSIFFLVTSRISEKSHGTWFSARRGREVNLLIPPFSFPKPLQIINDSSSRAPDKRLILWKIKDIPTFKKS